MKSKIAVKLFTALALIMAVAISPAALAAFAEEEVDEVKIKDIEVDGGESDKEKNTDKQQIKDEIRKLRDEIREERKQLRDQYKDNPDELRDQLKQLRDEYKNKIRPYINDLRPYITDRPIDDDRPDVDRKADLKFRGKTSGWAILGGQAFPSTIGLTGEAFHVGKGVWKIHSNGLITVSDHKAELVLKGTAKSGKIMLHGTGILVGSDDKADIRIQLRGHYAPVAGSENEFAIGFTHAQIHNKETGHRIPLSLVGSVMVENVGPEPVEPEFSDIPQITPNVLS